MTTYSGRHDRTGTWQFMSAALLGSPGQLHVFEDDIESFVHVVGWTVLSYLPSPMDKDDRAALVSYLYDHSWKTSSGEKGGLAKVVEFKFGNYPPKDFTPTKPSPTVDLIRSLASPFRARYSKPPPEEDEEVFKELMPRHRLGLERLTSSKWFLSTIRDALARSGWPAEDRAGDKLAVFTKDIVGNAARQRAARRVKTDSHYYLHPRGH